MKVDPPAECVPDAKIAFDQPVRETNCRSLQADRVGVVRDTKKQANSEERCRGIPPERIVIDALMKRPGNRLRRC